MAVTVRQVPWVQQASQEGQALLVRMELLADEAFPASEVWSGPLAHPAGMELMEEMELKAYREKRYVGTSLEL